MKFIKDMIARRPSNGDDADAQDMQKEMLQQDLEDSGFGGSVLSRAEMHSRDPFVKKAMASEEAAIEAGIEEEDPVAAFEAERDAYGDTLRAGLEGEMDDFDDEEIEEDDVDVGDLDDDQEELVAEEDSDDAEDDSNEDFDDSDPLAAELDDEDDDFEDEFDDEFEDDVEPEDKEALLAEIRDAMGAMSHIKPDEEVDADAVEAASRHGAWAEDEEFGRQAIARAALDQIDEDDVGSRLLEKTNSKFSDGEGSRRRLALAHMKAAAAATKADRVLKKHTGRDPSNDPEEQFQYREDLAKVMRPHEPEMEHEEPPMETPKEPRDHASHRVMEDPVTSRDWRETSEDESIPSIRSDVGGESPDTQTVTSRPITQERPFSQRRPISQERILSENRPVSEARPISEARPTSEGRVTSEGRKRIWDMDDEPETAAEPILERPTAPVEPTPEPAAAAPTRRPGRVKTRIIGFQPSDSEEKDIFDAAAKQESHTTKFPVGWIVVTSGPGRGAAFTLFNGISKIGRGDGQSVTLDFGDNSISRDNHAAIAYDEEGRKFFLGHGGKSNIVRLNDKPVLSTEEISDGDIIRIGETSLTFVSFCGEDFSWDEQGEGGTDHAAIA